MENKEQDGFDSGRGSSSNPIQLPEVIVYGKRPLPWYKRALNGVAKFVNDEIFLNKDNIRVKNARRHPKAMDAVQEGGNIAGAIVAAPFAAYTAVQAAPVVMPALKVAGQAVTPSTWIGGVAQATGYQAPAWLLNGADLAASAYYANEAGKDIDKNGLTWRTGFNALMSLAPMTRETEAIEGVANTLRRPTQAVSSVVDDFRAARNAVSSPEAVLGREFSRSVKNTRFVNTPVEHVSQNGITDGSALDVGEEGIHLSPAGSETTINIQRRTGYPFVRTGTWTFSNNTRPESVQDLGYFGRGFNQEFDSKIDKGVVNFKYVNNFEGKGNQSFLTTEPSFGLQLSKNVLANRSRRFVFNIPQRPSPRILAGNQGVITTPEPMVISPTNLGGHIDSNNFSLLKNKLTDQATEQFILPWEEQLRQFYNSGFYARRLAKAGLLSKRDHILQWKNRNLDRTQYGIGDSSDLGSSYGNTTRYASETHPRPYVIFNTDYDFPLKHTVIHEGSHASSLSLPEIRQHNNKLLENVWEHVRPEMRDNPQVKEYIDYITDAKIQSNNENALASEIGGQLQNAFLHMQRNNLTPDQLLSDVDYISRDHELRNAIAVFTPSYLKKLLAPGGIISSVLLAVNNKNDDRQ